MISVSDNGAGMDLTTKSQMFDPFFTTKGQGKGTGLGLAIVSDIVKQTGAQVFVQSEIGLGMTVKIFFPRVDGALQDATAEVIDSSPANETILLVEDEDSVRESIAEYLSQRGYTMLKANGGPQALALAASAEQPIDLLLTDVIMPRMRGPELAQQVKSSHPDVKIAFMSGYSDNLLSNRQVLDPGHVLLQKPVRLATLAQRLREILDRGTAAEAAGK